MSTAAVTLPVHRHRQPVLRTILISSGLALVAWGRALPSRRPRPALCEFESRRVALARHAAVLLRDAQPRYGFHS